MRKIVLVVFASFVIAAGAADSVAQTAGVSVSTVELRESQRGGVRRSRSLGRASTMTPATRSGKSTI